MRTGLAIAVVILQVGVLAYMAGEREWVLRTGRVVHLRTAPVDPNDPMRGDYLRLGYEISSVPRRLCRDAVLEWLDKPQPYRQRRDERVYATLRIGPDGIAELVTLSDRRPAAGLYLSGRVVWPDTRSIRVRYGIEALFTEQGKAKAIEAQRRQEMNGVPLDVEVAVSPGGLAVLKGYQWESLGITLTVDRRPPAQPGSRQPGITGATVELKNHGAQPVAIVALPGDSSFQLVPNEQWGENHFRWVGAGIMPPKPQAGDVIVLSPGASRRTHLDFAAPQWSVVDTKAPAARPTPVALPELSGAWGTFFRIEYAPPPAEECAGLPNAALIRQSRLVTRTFSPAEGRVD